MTIQSPAAAQPNHTCPLCGGPNGCRSARNGDFAAPCWCNDVRFDPDLLARVPEAERNRSCLCRQCATAP